MTKKADERTRSLSRRNFGSGRGGARLSIKKIVLNTVFGEFFVVWVKFFCMPLHSRSRVRIRAYIVTFKQASLLVDLDKLKL